MKVAVLIDGGHLRALARFAGHTYNPDFIEKVAQSCVQEDETLLRVLYYDCAPFEGTVKLPVSGKEHKFAGSDHWLRQLAAKNLFAVRRGVLKFRGFKPKKNPHSRRGIKGRTLYARLRTERGRHANRFRHGEFFNGTVR
jgi:hypothetical protein